MAPAGDRPEDPLASRRSIVVLPSRGQVIFPSIRGAIEVSKRTFQEVCDFLERTGADGVGIVAARPPGKKAAAGNISGELYEVGTYCRLVSHSTTGAAKGTGGEDEAGSGRFRLVVEGKLRFQVLSYTQTSPFRVATVQVSEETEMDDGDVAVRALVHSIQEKMTELMKSGQDSKSPRGQFRWPSSASMLASVVGSMLPQLSIEERQQILETVDLRARLEFVLDLLQRETEAKRMSSEISSNIQKSRELELRGVVLQRQIQEVQRDLQKIRTKAQRNAEGPGGTLGEAEGEDEEEDEVTRLGEKLSKVGLTEDAGKIAKRELRRLKSIQPHHPEYTITHTYLELMAGLPWQQSSEDRFDIAHARRILDEDHRGLGKVKLRILEFLAVQKMRGNMKGPILCLHGPPGIGKTSLGRSVARALGRKFHRIALGGVRDEAELRGHRRTYIGSIPGVIIQGFQTLGVNNPVVLLDEVDKMSKNSMFNPQATLLEILDPEQNDSFKDHYLNTPFDLSRVLFICTANDTSLIDRPLLDRMEVIELSGYTVEEKVAITETHLLPKQRRLHALEPEPVQPAPAPDTAAGSSPAALADVGAEGAASASKMAAESPPQLEVTPDAVRALITKWTSESGVRSLDRHMAQICRWAALRLQGINVDGHAGAERDEEREAALATCGPAEDGRITVDAQHLQYVVGVELFEPNIAERLSTGVAMGLSVSAVGGQLLFIEATRSKGSGRLTITGQLGKVMAESVETALSLLRSRFVRVGKGVAPVSSEVLNLLHSTRAPGDTEDADSGGDRDPFKGEDIHVHFPAGGIPKDGPSAGVAVLLALASLLLGKPMRSDTAVTGEVTLRGHVLPVGGIRDKVLAAHRAGVSHVLLPLANKRNVLEDIPAKTLAGIEVHYMKHVDEALDWAFGRQAGMSEADVAALASSDLPVGMPAAAGGASWHGTGCELALPRSRL